MERIELCKRKYEKEVYTYYLCSFQEGEVGIFGIPIKDYIVVHTPENCCGYEDHVMLHYDKWNKSYYVNTSYRYLQPWILKKIKKKLMELYEKYELIIY